eukprot:scaffold309083_cov33-Tisochrysis_lutea.AAC.1
MCLTDRRPSSDGFSNTLPTTQRSCGGMDGWVYKPTHLMPMMPMFTHKTIGAVRVCAHDQIPPLSVVKGRPSWMPEFDVSYHNTLAMLQSPVSFMAQPPTQPVAAP